MHKNIFAIFIGLVIIGIALLIAFGGSNRAPVDNSPTAETVSVVDGIQIIDLRAKGGFTPQRIIAKADMPTILRVTTQATFDCSSSIRIPSLKIGQNLAPTGVSDIDLGTPKAGILDGSCGMGMYPFEIDFQ